MSTQTTETKPAESTTSSVEDLITPTPTESKPSSETPATSPGSEGVKSEETAAKPVETPKEESKVDEEYELEVAEGSLLSQEDVDDIAKIAEELNLSKDQAMKLVANREEVMKKAIAKGEDKWEQAFTKDLETLTKDPMFSGAARKEADVHMGRALTAFGTKELVDYLNTKHGGSNIHLAKFLVEIGKAIAPAPESTTLTHGQQTQATTTEKPLVERLYPGMFEKK